MSNRKNEIEKLKSIFEKAKTVKRSERGYLVDLDLHMELWGAIAIVGKENFYELKDEIYPYLNDPFAEFREDAVATLGWISRLQLPEFKEKSYEIWHTDPDDDVRVAALGAWYFYYSETCDATVLRELYSVLTSKNNSIRMRVHALNGIMHVGAAYTSPGDGYETLALCDIEDEDELEQTINWEEVYKVMKKCIPGWTPKS